MKDGKLDRSDISLLHILLRDSRATKEQMEEASGLSADVIGSRIDAMRQAGVIRRFTTKPTLACLEARSILVWGRSRLNSLHAGIQGTIEDDRVAWLAHSTSGRFYAALHLQKGDDLAVGLGRLEGEAMMIRPSHAERDLFTPGPERFMLKPLDWRIIGALREDPGISPEDISFQIDEDGDKVSERLEQLISSGALDFSIDLDLNSVSNPLAMLHLESLEPKKVKAAAEELMREHAPSILFFNTYSNMRQLTTALVLVQDWEELMSIVRSFQERPEFPFVEVSPILSSTSIETWRDKMVRKNGRKGR